MKKGEKGILLGIVVTTFILMSYKGWQVANNEKDPGIPFYSTASDELAVKGSVLYRQFKCRDCHSLWGVRSIMQAVPTPAMDGMGSLRDEEWLFNYFSAQDPQSILPTRLKKQYQMPSFAFLTEQDRRTLARYISSLKVEDWYLEEVKKAEFERITGRDYQP